MQNKIDHFVIGADSLEQGIADMEARRGVSVPRGGKHDAMSTYNAFCILSQGLAIDCDRWPIPLRSFQSQIGENTWRTCTGWIDPNAGKGPLLSRSIQRNSKVSVRENTN